MHAGFDDEGSFNEGGLRAGETFPLEELLSDGCVDAWVDNSVEAVELGAIGKNDRGKLASVDAMTGIQDFSTKFRDDFVISGLARFGELVGKAVGINYREIEIAEHFGDDAFAAGDAAGDADALHGHTAVRRWESIVPGSFDRAAGHSQHPRMEEKGPLLRFLRGSGQAG